MTTGEETQEEREARFERVYNDFKERRWSGEYAGFDFSVPMGWLDLVIELDAKLAQVVPTYTLAQAKSKYGGLRYYINYPDDDDFGYGSVAGQKASAIIAEYEERSFSICESCGEPGKTSKPRGYWVWTLCDAHEAELAAV